MIFFDSVPHSRLKEILNRWIACPRTLALLEIAIGSYDSKRRHIGDAPNFSRGIPLGNLTSQFFCNVVLMPFDRFVSEQGYTRTYIRYADDCFVLGQKRDELSRLGEACKKFFCKLGFVCRSVVVRYDGFEALGHRFFTNGVVLRRHTRFRAVRKCMRIARRHGSEEISAGVFDASFQSFLGLSGGQRDVRWTKYLQKVILDGIYAP